MRKHVDPLVCRWYEDSTDSFTSAIFGRVCVEAVEERTWGANLAPQSMRVRVCLSVACCNLNANCKEVTVSSHGLSFRIYNVAFRCAKRHHSTQNHVLHSDFNLRIFMPQQMQKDLHNSNKLFIQCTLHFIPLTISVATFAGRINRKIVKEKVRYTLDK
jgi:hypothetical protein